MKVGNRAIRKEYAAFMMVVPPVWAVRENCLTVPILVPDEELQSLLWEVVGARKMGEIKHDLIERYRRGYRRQLYDAGERGWLSPGVLRGRSLITQREVILADTHTLICTCKLSEAQAGRCHRCWAVPALRHYGWEIEADFEGGA